MDREFEGAGEGCWNDVLEGVEAPVVGGKGSGVFLGMPCDRADAFDVRPKTVSAVLTNFEIAIP